MNSNKTMPERTGKLYGLVALVFCSTLTVASPPVHAAELTLKQAVDTALASDVWRSSNEAKQQASLAQGEAVATLPDPKLSLSLANVPASSFDLSSEPMTQIQLGLTQNFERGEELKLKQQKWQIAAEKLGVLQQQRDLQLTRDVSLAWLDAFQSQQTLKLIRANQELFQQLLQISRAGYASALGRSRQQDVIQSELELTQLQDKQLTYEQKLNAAKAELLQWLLTDNASINQDLKTLQFDLSPTLDASPININDFNETWPWYQMLASHPQVLLIDKNQQMAEKQIAVEQQKYRPKWGVKGSYGIRQDGDNGAERSDLFSIGLSMEIPLFSNQKQDQTLKVAKLKAQSVKTDKQLLVRELVASAQMQLQDIKGLQNRLALYENELLPQVRAQAEVLLSAYTHDDGDFFAVARARTMELDTQILALKIKIDLQKAFVKFRYFTAPYLAIKEHQQ